ncbi:MAG: zinc dependent phospholipase C family protein [Myxococcota bacterium]|nr:zinc dependent phospholipase C family protein [Myxococcota bacterium]
MSLSRLGAAVLLALVVLVLFPTEALAWTPGTHIFLGEAVLGNLTQLPQVVADLLRAYPYDFLYGNIAADTSIAKKYAPVGRHCHSWNVANEIKNSAATDPLRAFAYGYFCHLAADTVAHNFFIPRQLVVTSRTIALGHSYWESRFEAHLGEKYAKTAMQVIKRDHAEANAHLDRILAPTIFSVRTGRRLFHGMVGVVETNSWHQVFKVLASRSRWDLDESDLERHMAAAYQLIMEVLLDADSIAKRLDPSGESSMHLAKRLRLDVVRNRIPDDHDSLVKLAEENFGLPEWDLSIWQKSAIPRPWLSDGESNWVH